MQANLLSAPTMLLLLFVRFLYALSVVRLLDNSAVVGVLTMVVVLAGQGFGL